MKKALFAFVSVLIMFSSAFLSADEKGKWMTDFEAAKKLAEKNKLLILADFSGSDWCGWCIKLDKEVFSKKEFLDFAAKKFVLLMVDFPQNKKIPASLKKQNDQLAAKYKVEGFPTVLIMDSKGKVIQTMGYEQGGPANYIKLLEKVIQTSKKQ